MLEIGRLVKGKWNKTEYLIIKKIGQGGLGTVYKVRDNDGNVFALKISNDLTTITREHDILKKLENISYIPKVYDLDDYTINNEKFYFLVIDYIEGNNLKTIINTTKLSLYNIFGIGIIILDILNTIYNSGYIYCDIKLENILIDSKNSKIMLVDFGGVIEKGQNIKEYTPVYNISSWGINVSESNDYQEMIIFSVTMIIVCMILKKEFNPLTNDIDDIIIKIKSLKINQYIKETIINGLKASYNSIDKYKYDLKKSIISLKNTNHKRSRVSVFIDLFFGLSISFFIILLIMIKIKYT